MSARPCQVSPGGCELRELLPLGPEQDQMSSPRSSLQGGPAAAKGGSAFLCSGAAAGARRDCLVGFHCKPLPCNSSRTVGFSEF